MRSKMLFLSLAALCCVASAAAQGAASAPAQTGPEVALKDKMAKADELKAKAEAVTHAIGDLAASGKLPTDQQGIELLKKLVDQLQEINDELKALTDEVKAVGKQMAEKPAPVPAPLSALKPTGYIQSQYLDKNLRDGQQHGFYIRRMRLGVEGPIGSKSYLKLTTESVSTASATATYMKDVVLTHNIKAPSATNAGFQVYGGQVTLPLGYEIERSSADLIFPERSSYEQKLFVGEVVRGLGMKYGVADGMTLQLGLWNSLTSNDAEFPASGNLGAGNTLGATGGIKWFKPGKYTFGLTTFQGTRPAYTANSVTSPRTRRQFYYGDFNYNGLFSDKDFVYGEIMLGRDRIPSATASATAVGKPMNGGHFFYGANVSKRAQLIAKYEFFNPNTLTNTTGLFGSGFEGVYELDKNVKFVAAFENILDQSRADHKRYQQLTLRVQYKL